MAQTKVVVQSGVIEVHYIGLSSDTKPTTGVNVGERWWSTDTDEIFAWSGTAWTQRVPMVQGPVAHDAVDAGNPIKIGGKASTGTPSTVADQDRVDAWFDARGMLAITVGESGTGNFVHTDTTLADGDALTLNGLVVTSRMQGRAPDALLDVLRTLGDTAGAGLGVLAVGARTPDSSEVISTIVVIGATSATRATVITPTSGKKIRVLKIETAAFNLTTDPDVVQVYFGTGAAVTTNPASVIAIFDTGTDGDGRDITGDGEGAIGAVDEVLSWRTETETETGLHLVIRYREE